MLDLVRLSAQPLFPPGGEPLYRQITLLSGLGPGDEILDVGSGNAVPLEYFVREAGAVGYGIESEAELLAASDTRVRLGENPERFHLQKGAFDDLPYRDAIFDVVVGELSVAAHHEPASVVAELCRVAKPGAAVVLIQLVWTAPVDEARKEVLCDHLGARPLMLVEWKRLLWESGVEAIHTEDWSDAETSFRRHMAKPFPDFAEIFSLSEKLGIYRRAWGRWGWRGVWNALARQREVHRLLTRERILGLYLVKGRRVGVSPDVEVAEEPSEGVGVEADSAPDGAGKGEVPEGLGQNGAASESLEEDVEVRGLPLFGDD